jgi:hypothetical protein
VIKKVNELFSMFQLPFVSSQGYQAKPRPELIGGSATTAISPTEALRLKAVNGLLRWTKLSCQNTKRK